MAITDGPVRGPFTMTRPRNIEDHARPGAGECAVVMLGTQLRRLPKGELPTSGIGWFRPRGQYWIVDLRDRGTSFDVELDSADRGLRFHGSIEVDWCVSDAELAAEKHPFDVKRWLQRRIVPQLTAAARDYGMDAVGELESWVARQQFTGQSGDGLLEILEISCSLRPDAEATGITRAGTLSGMKRGNAAEVIREGEIGLMAEALVQNPETAMDFYRDLQESKRLALLAHLEMAKAVTGAKGSEEHERAHAFNELANQLRNILPSSATQLPTAGAEVPRQLGENRSRRRDRRARERDSGVEDTVVNEDGGRRGDADRSRHDDE